jgi:hypothetical protein
LRENWFELIKNGITRVVNGLYELFSRQGAKARRTANQKNGRKLFMSISEKKSSEVAPPTGDMPAEEFRRFGHEIVDWIANYFERIEELPVLAQVEPGELKAQLPSSPPEKGESSVVFRLLRHINFRAGNFR